MDHPGVVYRLSTALSRLGINIESMDAGASRAPMSASPLFSMTARVIVPPHLVGQGWEDALEDAGEHSNVDVKVSAVEKQ